MRRKQKFKSVHFEFAAHAKSQPYSRRKQPKKKTRTLIAEHAGGTSHPLDEYAFMFDNSRFGRTGADFFKEAIRKGDKVLAGESFVTREQQKKLGFLNWQQKTITENTEKNPTLGNIKALYECEAETDSFRHNLIVETVKREEKPIEGRYGTRHSLLTAELKKQGINSSREITPQVFSWVDIVVRKLMLGKKPTDFEYKKAFISDEILKRLWRSMLKEKGVIFNHLLVTTLINQLSEEQISQILESKKYNQVFKLNGISWIGERKKIVEFLNKHSSFWKMQQNIAKRKRKIKKKKKMEKQQKKS